MIKNQQDTKERNSISICGQNYHSLSNDNKTTRQQDKKSPSDDENKNTGDVSQLGELIGDFGSYQFMIFMFKILIGVTSAFNNLGVTFYAPTGFINYRCAVNSTTLATATATTTTSSNLNHSSHVGASLPAFHLSNLSYSQEAPGLIFRQPSHNQSENIFHEFLYSEQRKFKHSQPLNYDTPRRLTKQCHYVSPVDNESHKCDSFEYDTGIWMSTIIDEWDLVCDRDWFVSMTQSSYMSGFLIAFLVFGYISDRFGRWNALFFGAVIEVLCGFGCALAGSVSTFMLFRFLVGFGNAGRTSASYLVMIEWCGPRWRMHISTLGSIGWVIGYCAMPWITLYYLHFRHMQLFVCFYELIFVLWLLKLPESPRWLLTHRKFQEAYDVLLMAAKFNGLIVNEKSSATSYTHDLNQTLGTHVDSVKSVQSALESTLKGHKTAAAAAGQQRSALGQPEVGPKCLSYTIREFDEKFARLAATVECKEFTKNEDKLSIIDLFRWKNLRQYALILFFTWGANSFIYYGIVLGVGDFGAKNLFVAFTIAGITEIPSIAFTIICMKYLPRKTANQIIFITTGVLCCLQILFKHLDYPIMQQWVMMLAKLFNSCAFTCILYQTMELFPTSIRHIAYAGCSVAGRVGSILAPFIKKLQQLTIDDVASLSYIVLSFSVALAVLRLPETKGADLPDTLLEAEKFKGRTSGDGDEETANNNR